MGLVGKITRRTLLVGSAAIAGGVAFGYYQYTTPYPNPLKDNLKEGEITLTRYLLIDQKGITIITPRAEMGQGVYSVLAKLVAEELDIAWEDIRVEHGPPSGAYYNGTVGAEGFPFAATDEGFMANNMRPFSDVVGKFMGMQITGGSSSVPDAYRKMRKAGAAARFALREAASQKTGISRRKLKTKDGHVLLPDGKKLSYIDLAAEASKIEIPPVIRLKSKKNWRYLGKSSPRVDMVDKCTGIAKFGIDISLQGMVYATIKANPKLGGKLEDYDDSKAKKAKGVIKIIPIASDEGFNSGVGVIADNTWRAFQAANLIKFTWGKAGYLPSNKEMFEEISNSFTEEKLDSQFKNEGNVDEALKDAKVITAEYKVPFLAHAPLEPMNAVAQFKDGQLDIWTGTQIPMNVVTMAAAMAKIDSKNVKLHVQLIGGSFGRRLEDDYIKQAIQIAIAMEGTPVKMTWTREEDMTHDFCRPAGMAKMQGTVKDSKVHTYDGKIAYPAVTRSQMSRLGLAVPGPDITIVAGAWDQPFRIPNYSVKGYAVSNLPPVSSWRSVGASGNGFFHDCFLDELIHAAGADPMEERIRLCWHKPSRKVLEEVAKMSNWGSKLENDRGRGVAFTLAFGVPTAEVIEVTNTAQGIKIDKVFAVAEVGTVLDPKNLEAQLSGGIIWGLGHAINSEITYQDGIPEQTNYHQFEAMRLYQTPKIEIKALENSRHIRGIGEPGVPPAAPALANAIFAATGKRIREMPFNKHIDFV